MKQKELSIWLRAVVILIGVAVIFLVVVLLPGMIPELMLRYPDFEALLVPCMVYVYVTVIPVLFALIAAWQIFIEIGRDNSFCVKNALRLRSICLFGAVDTVLYIAAAVILGSLGALLPSLLVIIICIVFMGMLITIAAAALSHLTRKAAEVQSENDLTI